MSGTLSEVQAFIAGAKSAREWQPIESCPPVGLFLLTYAGSHSVVVIGWRDGSRDSGFEMEGSQAVWFKPTHWMPLPESPLV